MRDKGRHVQILSDGLFLFFLTFAAFCFPSLVAFDQFCEVTGLLGHPHKFVFEEFAGCWTLLNLALHKDSRDKMGGYDTYIAWISL